jgi:hypothetical protein
MQGSRLSFSSLQVILFIYKAVSYLIDNIVASLL